MKGRLSVKAALEGLHDDRRAERRGQGSIGEDQPLVTLQIAHDFQLERAQDQEGDAGGPLCRDG